MATQGNEAIFRRVMEEGFGKGNTDVLPEVVSPDFIENETGPGEGRGFQGLKTIIHMLRTAFPDLRVSIEEIIEVGDKTWARVTFEGTNTGDLGGVPPTGKRATWGAIDECRYAAGKMVEHWGQIDRLGMLEQLGLAPESRPGRSVG